MYIKQRISACSFTRHREFVTIRKANVSYSKGLIVQWLTSVFERANQIVNEMNTSNIHKNMVTDTTGVSCSNTKTFCLLSTVQIGCDHEQSSLSKGQESGSS